MNHKRAVKKLMGCGFSRNEANIVLRWYNERKCPNKFSVERQINFVNKCFRVSKITEEA